MACEYDATWAWKLLNASNIVMVGTPQTESTPMALAIVDSDMIEVFGTLNTRGCHKGPSGQKLLHCGNSLISVNNTKRLRIVTPNALRAAMLIDSDEPTMRVPNVCFEKSCAAPGWASAAIAWDS